MFIKKSFRLSVVILFLICILLISCGPSAEEQAETSSALTAAAATDTLTPTPTPSITPSPTPTPTVTPIPPTPTNIPADQGPITIGRYEIQFTFADIQEGFAVTVDARVKKLPAGYRFIPIAPDPKARELLINVTFITGDRESFYEYGFQVIDQDGNLFEIKTILDNEVTITWVIPVPSSSISFMVLCPDGEVIDLAPIMK